MLDKIKNNAIVTNLFNTKNIGLYALALVAFSVTWSSVRIIQKNYELEKSITSLQQQVAILDQQTQNQKLINEYYKTDSYLDLAARKYFSKAAPGEKIIIVPAEVANTYIVKVPDSQKTAASLKKVPKILQNLTAWGDFLSGKKQQ
jgi:cell division protein FtsB